MTGKVEVETGPDQEVQAEAPRAMGFETPGEGRAERRPARQSQAAEPAAWPRYPELLRELRALEAEAQEAKHREAQAALIWIRKAIADCAVTPVELGFAVKGDR